ncbi:MAG TPA: protoporphyrinogen oxidase HemJ [Sulfurimonas sp.]|nr:protoporphyrinogen oxidase HemJ [Sulfurimonas sp.]HIM75206.1 protoporphyrinogen oxidase HemJ [Campylobacterales bacterium]
MYEWILWFHVLSFISWFSAVFYMPRLLVYHAEHIENKDYIKVLKIQEMKLMKVIGFPAMWATLISGSGLVYFVGFSGGWLHVKITFVLILIAYFVSLDKYRKDFAVDKCQKSGKFFRMYNEVPTVLMMVIVAMVVFKPF